MSALIFSQSTNGDNDSGQDGGISYLNISAFFFPDNDAVVFTDIGPGGKPRVCEVHAGEILGYNTKGWSMLQFLPKADLDHLIAHAPAGEKTAKRFSDWIYGEVFPDLLSDAEDTEDTEDGDPA